ncbi:UNVERIFIED_CONTAM: hypothetical protein Sindi_0931600 [Sesamum indicum]
MTESQTAAPTLSIPNSSQIAVKEQPPRITYAKVVENPLVSHFQHDPARAAKKTFQDDEIHTTGSDSSYKGEPGIIYSSEETAQLASRLKFTLVDLTAPKVHVVYLNIEGKTYRQQILYENCPPYCSSCNHLGHDIATCIVKLNNEKSQADLEPMLLNKLSNQMEEIRDLRELINNKRKGKNMLIANDSAAALNINQNSDQLYTEKTRKLSSDDFPINANAVEFPTSHVHVPESLITSESNLEGKTVVASPNDLTYEDRLIAELLDKDWDADKTSQNKRHPTNIDDVKVINN